MISELVAVAAYAKIITCQLEPLVFGVAYTLPVTAGCTALDVRVAVAHDAIRAIETGALDGHEWSAVPLP